MLSQNRPKPSWPLIIIAIVVLFAGCRLTGRPQAQLPTRVPPVETPALISSASTLPTAVPTLLSTAAPTATPQIAIATTSAQPPVPESEAVDEARQDAHKYAVVAGDTLWGIAARFGLTVGEIREMNGLAEGAFIYPGDELLLSVDPALVAAVERRNEVVARPTAVSEREVAPIVAPPQPVGGRRDGGSAATLPTIGGPWTGPIVEQDTGYCDVKDGFGWNGALTWPVAGRAIKEERGFRSGHTAVDILGNGGDPVHAAAPGVVIWAGFNIRGYGNLVVLAHGGGWQTHYVHLNDVTVSCGKSVSAGQLIGHIGRTGGASFYHLHFELRRFDVAYNPLDYLP